MVETLIQISAVLGAIVAIGGSLAAIITPIRKRIVSWYKNRKANKECDNQQTKKIDELATQVSTLVGAVNILSAGNKSVLRNHITEIYYKNLSTRTLKAHEKENLVGLYEAYKAQGGNSYIDSIYQDMMTWTVVGG